MHTARLATLCVVFALLSAAASGQEYEIKLERPAKVGDIVARSTTITGKLHIVAKDGSTIVDDMTSTYTIDYAAEITVLEVDSTGNVLKDTHRIIRCKRVEDEVTIQYFEPGTVIAASLEDGREVFRKDGKPVTAQQEGVLRTLITLGSGRRTEDEVFGTKEPRKIGDTWPINTGLASEDMTGVMPKAPSYSGRARLIGLVTIDGTDCLEVQVEMNNADFAPVAPREVTVISGASRLHAVSDYPLDTSLPMLKRHSVYSCDFQTFSAAPPEAGQRDHLMTVDTHYEKETNTTISPVKQQSPAKSETAN